MILYLFYPFFWSISLLIPTNNNCSITPTFMLDYLTNSIFNFGFGSVGTRSCGTCKCPFFTFFSIFKYFKSYTFSIGINNINWNKEMSKLCICRKSRAVVSTGATGAAAPPDFERRIREKIFLWNFKKNLLVKKNFAPVLSKS